MIFGRKIILSLNEEKSRLGAPFDSIMVLKVVYSILLKITGETIGEIYYINHSREVRKAEIVIEIRPFYQGQGWGGDALFHLVDDLFIVQNYQQVFLFVAKENQRAQNLYVKLGFQVGKVIVHGAYDPEKEEMVEILEMFLEKDRWLQWRNDYLFKE